MNTRSIVPRTPKNLPCSAHRHGFTLIEILVALTIVAIALGAGLRALGNLTRTNEDLRQRMLAQWSAENRLAILRLAPNWPEPGTRSIRCDQGGVALSCEEIVSSTPNPNFRRIEIAVKSVEQPDNRLATLITVIANGNSML